MAHLENSTSNGTSNGTSTPAASYTLQSLPKSNVFTQNLPADSAFPTPSKSHAAPRQDLGPRLVKDAVYTYVRPEPTEDPELLCVSSRALRDLGLHEDVAHTEEFKEVVAGNKILTWDEKENAESGGIYPWAQCYGGYQFGQWASQLGDGRAISLFEATNENTDTRYEIQLKGAGRTPYSRFADGKAVLRSSIREFVVSEYLNAIGIPSTRALALTHCRGSKVFRERMEPGAIVTRFAQSWIRFGTFDLPRMRGDRKILRELADYTAEHVYGGWHVLPSKLPAGDAKETYAQTQTGIQRDTIEGEALEEENRYTRLYRAIIRRNALTVAKWQAHGFMNGVLNTDNTSILGLSIDFGPFAFLDTFDPTYTPNHDDHMLRYSYRNQPTIIWWNLVRLGEALGELMGAGSLVDDPTFVEKGVTEEQADELVKRAEGIIERCGEEYKAVFLAEYKRVMTSRLGLKSQKDSDFDELFSEFLDYLEAYELDFHHAFRKLSTFKLGELESEQGRKDIAGRFFRFNEAPGQETASRARIGKWLEKWVARVKEDWGEGKDEERQAAMLAVNPKFVPRSWVLDELIERVEKKGERDILPAIMKLNLDPFKENWGWDEGEEERFCGDVPKWKGMMQCSCTITATMLPDEILAQLNSEFSCRESQIQQLAALYNAHLPSPTLLVAHGLTATGKSSIIRSYLKASSLPFAVVNSRECITGRHLLERTVASCLDALDEHYDENTDRRPYARTENLSSLAVALGRMLEGRQKFVLVLDGIDAQREAPPTLLPALARFGETIPNLSIILITTLPIPHALHRPGIPHVHFPSYTRSSLLTILAQQPPKIFLTPPSEEQYPDYTPDLAAEDDAWLWGRFLTAVYESLTKHTGRDLVSFRLCATRLWRPFVEPIVQGTFGTRDFSRLMVNRRALFQVEDSVLDKIVAETNLGASAGGPAVPATPSTKRRLRTIAHDLPYYTTHLLIAAYLASYNPSRTDVTYFMKHTDKRKNKRRAPSTNAGVTKSKHRKISRHLLTPSPFSLDRLLAIFRALLVETVPQSADLYTQIATLTSMRLLVKAGGAGSSDALDPGTRWRVNFGWEYARSLGRIVNLEVGEYLVGGVD
ncbi:hypothetical protein N0V90_010907 [Kalmusia sp. IMI 367209]|nr:hypothetical protein N0V90_010907 [Kalmusia sp. IMI 367209]